LTVWNVRVHNRKESEKEEIGNGSGEKETYNFYLKIKIKIYKNIDVGTGAKLDNRVIRNETLQWSVKVSNRILCLEK